MKNLNFPSTSPSARVSRFLPVLLVVGLATTLPALAQPDTGAGIKNNPPNVNIGGRGGNRGGNRPDRAAMQTRVLQRQLTSAGVTDATVQEAITTYVANRQAARKPLTDAAAALAQTLADANATPAQTASALATYKAALAAEKVRIVAAEAELDGQVDFSKNPKLEAALLMAGVIGDGQSYLDAPGNGRGNRGGGFGGFGGGGGFNGAGGGGRGGNRGGDAAPVAN